MVPKFHVATACFSCSPPDLNSSKWTPLLWRPLNCLLNFPNYNFNIPRQANQNSAVSVIKFSLLITLTSSLLFYPYQKDERALPGNFLTTWCSFSPPGVAVCLSCGASFSLCWGSCASLPNSLSLSLYSKITKTSWEQDVRGLQRVPLKCAISLLTRSLSVRREKFGNRCMGFRKLNRTTESESWR
jgi:hypothetical protein